MTWLALVLAFVGALAGGIGAQWVAGRYTRQATTQRDEAARREEWWRRYTWAADHALEGTVADRAVGFRTLTALGNSDLAGPDELALLEPFSAIQLADWDARPDTEDNPGQGGAGHDEEGDDDR